MQDTKEKKIKVLAIIGARSGSKGVPHKNIKPLAGKPLMAWVIGAARASRYVNRVVVCTDSEEYARIAREHGAEVPYIQPAEISRDLSTDFDYINYAVRWLEEHEGYVPDLVVRMLATVPMQLPEDVDACVKVLLHDPQADSAMVIAEARQPPQKALKITPEGYLTSYLAHGQGPEPTKREAFERAYFRANVVVTRPRVIKETRSLSGKRVRYHLIPQERAVDIDSPIDFFVAEQLMNKFGENLKGFTLS